MQLTEEQVALLLSDDEVSVYQERGWYVSPNILDDDVIDEAAPGAERHRNGHEDWPLPILEGFTDWKPGDSETIRIGEIIVLRNRSIRALAAQPIISAIAARLTGSNEIRLWESELIQKPPRAVADDAAVGWHTVVEDSHRWPLEHNGLGQFKNIDPGTMDRHLVAGQPGARKVSMTLEKGQVSFHNSLLLYGSNFNRSDKPRLCLALHLQDGENEYRKYYNEAGELWKVVADRMCATTADGEPDYRDPDVCPVFWRNEPALSEGVEE